MGLGQFWCTAVVSIAMKIHPMSANDTFKGERAEDKMGPRTNPWGAPQVTGTDVHLHSLKLRFTLWEYWETAVQSLSLVVWSSVKLSIQVKENPREKGDPALAAIIRSFTTLIRTVLVLCVEWKLDFFEIGYCVWSGVKAQNQPPPSTTANNSKGRMAIGV